MSRKAWEIERQMRMNAIPLDRRQHASQWKEHVSSTSEQNQVARFWHNRVPGSGAPDSLYVGMVQSMANQGYDMTSAEVLLERGLELVEARKWAELRAVTALLMEEVFKAPLDPTSTYRQFHHPSEWQDIVTAMHPEINRQPLEEHLPALDEQIYHGWLGQLTGGSFGTAIEGYSGVRLHQVYGDIDGYITEPETTNDDVVYELVFLDVFEKIGRDLTSRDIALEWVRQIPYGYSAEWIALQNIQNGIFPPQSGLYRNPYSDWIGAQMRGMVCGMLAPAWPFEAARLAYLDAQVSHAANGVYGEIYAAVMTALAFTLRDTREIIQVATHYLPQGSQYVTVINQVLQVLQGQNDPNHAWSILDEQFKTYNWIHAYPNLAADMLALWYSRGDMTHAFALLAQAGLDVDCNGGLVGNILGVMQAVPAQRAQPLGDLLETYLPGKESLSIRQLASRTSVLAR